METKRQSWYVWLAILIGVVVLAAMATRVGGISIRAVGLTGQVVLFNAPTAMLPGAPVQLFIDGVARDEATRITVRIPDQTFVIGPLRGRATSRPEQYLVEVPCDIGYEGPATLVVVDWTSQQVLAQSDGLVQLLAAGPDCFLK